MIALQYAAAPLSDEGEAGVVVESDTSGRQDTVYVGDTAVALRIVLSGPDAEREIEEAGSRTITLITPRGTSTEHDAITTTSTRGAPALEWTTPVAQTLFTRARDYRVVGTIVDDQGVRTVGTMTVRPVRADEA